MQDFAYEISHTRGLVARYLASELEQRGYAGLAPSHGDILSQLCQTGEVRMSELSRLIDRDPSTVTALVRKLVALGFAETRRDDADRRVTVVSLTARGKVLERDFREISRSLRSTWEDGVDAADLEAAGRVLRTMQGNLRNALVRLNASESSAEQEPSLHQDAP